MTVPPPPASCEDVEPLLPLIADGAIGVEQEPAAFAHLADCAHCQEQLARHDLVTLALAPAGAPARRRTAVLRLPLPWIVLGLAPLGIAAAWWSGRRPAAPSR